MCRKYIGEQGWFIHHLTVFQPSHQAKKIATATNCESLIQTLSSYMDIFFKNIEAKILRTRIL